MHRILFLAALGFATAALAVNAAVPANSREGKRVEHTLGTDRSVAGASVLVRQPVNGDLFVAGGEVDVVATVEGDAVLAGGRVRLDAAAREDVYAAGGRVAVDASVTRNVRIAGGSVQIGPRARIGGSVSIAAGKVDVLGAVEHYLQIAAGHVYIDGPIGGDVEVAGRDIELGPNARIGGTLRYLAEQAPVLDPDAQVAGGVHRFMRETSTKFSAPPWRGLARIVLWLWTVGLMLLAAVLVAGFPEITLQMAATGRRRLGLSLVLGFVGLVVIPSAAVVIASTAVGVPIALLAGLFYLGLLLAGYVTSGILLGDAVLSRWGKDHAQRTGRRAIAAALAILLIGLIARVPIAGPVATVIALLIGMGAVLLQFRRTAPAA